MTNEEAFNFINMDPTKYDVDPNKYEQAYLQVEECCRVADEHRWHHMWVNNVTYPKENGKYFCYMFLQNGFNKYCIRSFFIETGWKLEGDDYSIIAWKRIEPFEWGEKQ